MKTFLLITMMLTPVILSCPIFFWWLSKKYKRPH
jgi:hypothetical protein